MPIHGFSSYSTLPLAMDFFFLGCLRKVLCPVSRPVTTLGCILLKDNNRAAGPEISSRACLCILQGARHSAICCFSIQSFIFLRISCLETPKKGSGPTNHWTEPLLASFSAISFPLTPVCPGTQYSPTACRVEMSFNAYKHTLRICNTYCLSLQQWLHERASMLRYTYIGCLVNLIRWSLPMKTLALKFCQ